ncbi:hypothetical protein [Acidithiobacillus sulfurivorans]|uniref:Uncharacterized protein n=1 Tax=Acidithiobacillus sulfurivorans TaxID=1958756 RepID=A0ABS6A3U4_9PROT|nr:hypothetical protein [Acidithiobacillus sulfurivorans]MBU2761250.1 hypothetical protein [Acidithiobacillus sulfurivorans]
MKGISDHLLSNLNPAQRCSVIFSALCREDFTEANRLADTAPTAIYTAGDFYNPFTRAMLTAALARGDIEQATAQVWANRCFWATRLHSEGIDDPSLDVFWSAATESRDRARSLWSAFAEAVTDAGMEPGEVMASMGGLSKLAQESVDASAGAEPCPDAVALYAAMLSP